MRNIKLTEAEYKVLLAHIDMMLHWESWLGNKFLSDKQYEQQAVGLAWVRNKVRAAERVGRGASDARS